MRRRQKIRKCWQMELAGCRGENWLKRCLFLQVARQVGGGGGEGGRTFLYVRLFTTPSLCDVRRCGTVWCFVKTKSAKESEPHYFFCFNLNFSFFWLFLRTGFRSRRSMQNPKKEALNRRCPPPPNQKCHLVDGAEDQVHDDDDFINGVIIKTKRWVDRPDRRAAIFRISSLGWYSGDPASHFEHQHGAYF